jgi:phosphatidylglycerophosphatase A
LGIFWFLGLISFRSWVVLVTGTVVGVALSVWLCGEAEKELGRKDPGSVVLDEIAALPLCFYGWVIFVQSRTGVMPDGACFISGGHWLYTLAVFALFRLFDVWKPWPIRQSQSLPQGWGITIDDCLAAVYVNVPVLSIALLTDLLNNPRPA